MSRLMIYDYSRALEMILVYQIMIACLRVIIISYLCDQKLHSRNIFHINKD
jgi:hypothetical protein